MIFDLDDTLIETSKCLTPHALLRAFSCLELDQASFSELVAIDARSLSSKEALRTFCQRHPSALPFLDRAVESLSEPLSDEILLEPVPGALETLEILSKTCHLALVTRGEEPLQLDKMKKAGIQPESFSKLIVSQGLSKKSDYKEVLDHFQVQPHEGLVCGDRILLDLAPAKELGLTTVFFPNGRGLVLQKEKEFVDVTIHSLTQLHEVLAKHEV